MTLTSVLYLLIFTGFSLACIFIVRSRHFDVLSEKTWNNKWITAASILSQVCLVLLVLDEFGLMLKEWDITFGFFIYLRKVVEIPGISQLLLIANFVLIIPAVFALSSGMLEQVKDENQNTIREWSDFSTFRKKYSLFLSFFVLAISSFFFLLQCFAFNEFQLDKYNNLIISVFYIFLILTGPVILMMILVEKARKISKLYNPYQYHPWFEKNMIFVVLLICFISLAQTMITKVILLLSIAEWANPTIIKLINYLIPKEKVRIASNKNPKYISLIKGIPTSSIWHKWAFIFLTTSFLPLLLIFQVHSSPYPPSDSAFPKTETISILYMLYMLTFLGIGNKIRFAWLKTILWTLFTVFILYITPIVFPSWFFPSIDPPGFSMLEILSLIANNVTASLFFLAFHLMSSIMFFLVYYSSKLKDELLNTGYSSVTSFRRYFLLSVSLNDIPPLIFFPSMWLIYRSSQSYADSKFYFGDNFLTLLIVFSLMIILFMILLAFMKRKRISEIKVETLQFGSEELITKLKGEFNLLNAFKSWSNKNNKIKELLFHSFPTLILFIILFIIDFFVSHL